MPSGPAKRLEWSRRALDAYLSSLARIGDEDPRSAELVRERVEHALELIRVQPGLGTPAQRRGERRFPIPKTGHVIHYRVAGDRIRIRLWYRARQWVKAS